MESNSSNYKFYIIQNDSDYRNHNNYSNIHYNLGIPNNYIRNHSNTIHGNYLQSYPDSNLNSNTILGNYLQSYPDSIPN